MKEITEDLGLHKKKIFDNEVKNFLKGFLAEIYENHTKTISLIEQISPYVSVSDYYKKVKERAEIMQKFLDEYGWIFVEAGVTNENEIGFKKEKLANFASKNNP